MPVETRSQPHQIPRLLPFEQTLVFEAMGGVLDATQNKKTGKKGIKTGIDPKKLQSVLEECFPLRRQKSPLNKTTPL